MTQYNAMILAGGQSRRMGEDKARLKISGTPLLRRVYDTAASGAACVYVIVTTDDYSDLLPPAAHLIPDRQSQGPLIGFAQGLAAMAPDSRSDWLLLLACDLPLLTAATVQQWTADLATLPPETGAYLPRGDLSNDGKSWDPLCGFYRPAAIKASLEQAVAQRERSFQRWLAGVAVAELMVADRRVLANCNTPADRAAIEAEQSLAFRRKAV
jgi:molybdenum cofactor guanylyltransferase